MTWLERQVRAVSMRQLLLSLLGNRDGLEQRYTKRRKDFVAAIEERKLKIATAAATQPTPPPLQT